jgi:hypothetical protein
MNEVNLFPFSRVQRIGMPRVVDVGSPDLGVNSLRRETELDEGRSYVCRAERQERRGITGSGVGGAWPRGSEIIPIPIQVSGLLRLSSLEKIQKRSAHFIHHWRRSRCARRTEATLSSENLHSGGTSSLFANSTRNTPTIGFSTGGLVLMQDFASHRKL